MYRRDFFEDDTTHISISQTAKNIPIDRVDNPYRIDIEQSRSTLKDGVDIRLHTEKPCQLRVFWFVNIGQFYAELDSADFRLSLRENRFLKDHSVYQESFNFETLGDYVQHVRYPDAESHLRNNNQTRREYPLVIIIHRSIEENSEDFFQSPIQVAALHVKSSIPNDPVTNFIMRVSKLADGRSLVLQVIIHIPDIFTPGSFNSDDACVVCLIERANHVLLPCKHACLCQNCFSALDKCPVCQRFATSYFKI